MEAYETLNADVLVIGSGGAGLRAAIEARETGADVLLVSKSALARGNNTAVAGSALAAAGRCPEDSPELHLRDTLDVGRYVNDRALVTALAQGAEQQVHDLERFGVEFARDGDGYFVLSLPSHTYPRVVKPTQGIGTGLTLPLARHAAAVGVRTMEKILITRLLRSDRGVLGAVGIDARARPLVFSAKAVILASGGLSRVFERTTNTPGATGDGYVLAYEVGAELQDMEFVQFLPATLSTNTKRLFLYEAFVESGAVFTNRLGEDVALRHGMKSPSQMTRDRVARAIMTEILEGRGVEGSVQLDFRGIPGGRWRDLADMRSRSKSLRSLERRAYPVAPSAHFAMGGVKISDRCETGVPGLLAAGEVCGGVHGANRLGPNALTEVFVFGKLAGRAAAEHAAETRREPLDGGELESELSRLATLSARTGSEDLAGIRSSLGTLMWRRGGIVRSGEGLQSGLSDLLREKEKWSRARVTTPGELWDAIEVRNLLLVAEMILVSAGLRRESRGAHFRTDFPEEDAGWLRNVVLHDAGGRLDAWAGPRLAGGPTAPSAPGGAG